MDVSVEAIGDWIRCCCESERSPSISRLPEDLISSLTTDAHVICVRRINTNTDIVESLAIGEPIGPGHVGPRCAAIGGFVKSSRVLIGCGIEGHGSAGLLNGEFPIDRVRQRLN